MEAALRDLAAKIDVSYNLLSQIIAYADDCDFICQNSIIVDQIVQEAPPILATWNLKMNISKTEITLLERSNDIDQKQVIEAWRKTKKLGSLLGDAEDVSHRKQLASVAFRNMWKIFVRHQRISECNRLRLYNVYVRPVLLYNCGTWGLTETVMKSLEAFHRRQLRS